MKFVNMYLIAILAIQLHIVKSIVNIPLHINNSLDNALCLSTYFDVNNCTNKKETHNHKDWRMMKPILSAPHFCRDETFIILQLNPNYTNLTYLVEVKAESQLYKYKGMFATSFLNVTNLKRNTKYKFRIWAVSADVILYEPIESIWIETLPENYIPMKAESIDLNTFLSENNSLMMNIAWTTKDYVCYCEVTWLEEKNSSYYSNKKIENITRLFETDIDISFDKNYHVGVVAKSQDWNKDSGVVWNKTHTPTCLELYQDLRYCVPKMPTGLRSRRKATSKSNELIYDIFVEWDRPEFTPQYYIVDLLISDKDQAERLNVSGNSINAVFEKVSLQDQYRLTLSAWSGIGESSKASLYEKVLQKPTKMTKMNMLFIVLPLTTVLVFLIICATIYIYYDLKRRTKKALPVTQSQSVTQYESLCPPLIVNKSQFQDEWEIDQRNIILLNVLGEGAFGVVYKAWLTNGSDKITVAVKMLKEFPIQEDLQQFKEEIELIKSVGKHPNIVSMLGCSIRNCNNGPMLIVEFCEKGDLLNYLRAIWKSIKSEDYSKLNGTCDSTAANQFSNKLYLMDVTKHQYKIKDLLSMALQISKGMEYLSNLRIVHRDLAARNVLVCDNGSVKISDFGLSRDIYSDNVYCKTSISKLPVKWMALESLTHQRYTTKSDVWSYGILLWEIVTLGENPYPGISIQELLTFLREGHRMACPIYCTGDIYSLMTNCWHANPNNRPTFGEIHKYLDKILETSNDYLNLDVSIYNEKDPISIEDYQSKPINVNRYVLP
ncbi:PREDICTED: tyrosine-protein kinase receptor torso-like isoform X1 [Nicrophorus vespilloides]|uniref:receptor protein-tyrosine kinase n=2 Tax=Nicrophorus vespilloides TaxID=110193 RepID=A0ABM1MU59_NICVS|nr:PREDICTED: tyrosine-protein kinase receptor torso-like isoform X1 [Nicrophorus vespilloides]